MNKGTVNGLTLRRALASLRTKRMEQMCLFTFPVLLPMALSHWKMVRQLRLTSQTASADYRPLTFAALNHQRIKGTVSQRRSFL